MKISRNFCIVLTAVSTAALILLEIFRPAPFSSETLDRSFFAITTRFIGALMFFALDLYLGYDILRLGNIASKKALFALPCFVVAVNNLPYIALILGKASITGGAMEMIMFALECVLVASFEEMAFRGVVFLSILKGRRDVKHIFLSIIISSAIFGIFHLINLFYGASIGDTLMQVGYSALIGAVCAFVLFKTQSIWLCVIVHATYNFCGQIVPRLGEGNMLNIAQIVITVIISVICAIYIIMNLINASPAEADRLYKKSGENND